jgi:FkbM family methyltransferase
MNDIAHSIRKIIPNGFLNRFAMKIFYKYMYELNNIGIYKMDHYDKYYQIQKGDIVVDAGAHIGLTVIWFAKAVGNNGKVVAIEPEQNNLRDLRKNLKRAGLNNVIVVDKALWSSKKKMILYFNPTHDAHSIVINQRKADDSGKQNEIEANTLDNILKEIKIDKVDFIKMNIEGAEIEALKGAEQTLKDNALNIAIEAHHEVEGEPTYKTIIPWLKNAQFETTLWNNWVVYAHKIKL